MGITNKSCNTLFCPPPGVWLTFSNDPTFGLAFFLNSSFFVSTVGRPKCTAIQKEGSQMSSMEYLLGKVRDSFNLIIFNELNSI